MCSEWDRSVIGFRFFPSMAEAGNGNQVRYLRGLQSVWVSPTRVKLDFSTGPSTNSFEWAFDLFGCYLFHHKTNMVTTFCLAALVGTTAAANLAGHAPAGSTVCFRTACVVTGS
jgi:hypothetical protein